MRESVIEHYLHAEVTKAGGTTRKFLSAARANNPDRIVIWPARSLHWPADIHFVELKRPGETVRPGQAREIARLQKFGCVVLVIRTKLEVDSYVGKWRR